MVFWATTNHTGEHGDKKQNTLPYTLQVKVVEVCLVYLLFLAVFKEEISKRFTSIQDCNISWFS